MTSEQFARFKEYGVEKEEFITLAKIERQLKGAERQKFLGYLLDSVWDSTAVGEIGKIAEEKGLNLGGIPLMESYDFAKLAIEINPISMKNFSKKLKNKFSENFKEVYDPEAFDFLLNHLKEGRYYKLLEIKTKIKDKKTGELKEDCLFTPKQIKQMKKVDHETVWENVRGGKDCDPFIGTLCD